MFTNFITQRLLHAEHVPSSLREFYMQLSLDLYKSANLSLDYKDQIYLFSPHILNSTSESWVQKAVIGSLCSTVSNFRLLNDIQLALLSCDCRQLWSNTTSLFGAVMHNSPHAVVGIFESTTQLIGDSSNSEQIRQVSVVSFCSLTFTYSVFPNKPGSKYHL